MVSFKPFIKSISNPTKTGRSEISPSEDKSELIRKKVGVIFDPLDERDISQLYGLGRIIRLNSGEVLCSEEEGNRLCIILEGMITEFDITSKEEITFGPGDVIGAMAFLRQAKRPASAVAKVPSVVMAVEQRTVSLLNEKVQYFLITKIAATLSERVEFLEAQNEALVRKNHELKQSLYAFYTDSIADYRNSELVAGIIRKIPKLPAYAHTLSARLLEKEADSGEIVDLIRQDPSLVADVLKSINSSYYGLRKKVSDIKNAVLLLGFQELYQLVMSEGLRRTMPDTPDFRALHSEALVISYIAFSLSISSQVGIPVQMATIGMLHNLGKSIVGLMKQKNPNLSVFVDSLDHPSLGAFLLEQWNLPSKICKTVKHQCFPDFAEPDKIPREVLNEVAVLYVARLCHGLIRGVVQENLPVAFFGKYQNILGWGELTVREILDRYVLSELRKKEDKLPSSVKKVIFKC